MHVSAVSLRAHHDTVDLQSVSAILDAAVNLLAFIQ